jgi:8-oxo-dGTP pyrophosphatase MutT (NUDIX family)
MRLRRMLLGAFGGLYHDLIGSRSPLGAAAVIFDADERVFLVQHSYGRRNWELPGGGRKTNESMEQTVRREVREETGIEVVIERLSGIYYQPHVDHHHFVFLGHVTPGSSPRARSPEILACGYWPVTALPRPISDFTVRRIDDARAKQAPVALTVVGRRRWIE